MSRLLHRAEGPITSTESFAKVLSADNRELLPRIVKEITSQTTSTTGTRVDDNVIRVGLNYHFGP